jgi:lysophospholipase L1-like esterase
MKSVIIRKANSTVTVAFGMVLILIFIAAMKHPLKEKDHSYTYLALGDSYTIGEQVPAWDNFPSQVAHLMQEQNISFKTPEIIAKTGWTTDELQAAINQASLQEKYDYVTLLIGVNNQYRGRKVNDYAQEFEKLLTQAIHFAGGDSSHVIILSIPDWGVTPFAKDRNAKKIASEIDAYNTANRIIAEKYHVHYVDITPGTRLAADDQSLLAPDGLHPSRKEYSIWAKQVAGVIKQNL